MTLYEESGFVLIKRDLFWRPNGQGYTGLLSEAGRYRLDQIYSHSWQGRYDPNFPPETTYAIPLHMAPEFTDSCRVAANQGSQHMTDLIPVRREDVELLSHAFKAYEEYANQEALDDLFEAVEKLQSAALSAPPSAEPTIEWEFKTVEGPRKGDEPYELFSDGWERDYSKGRSGAAWERFDFHEEYYWKRQVSHPLPSGEAVELEWNGRSLFLNDKQIGYAVPQDDMWVWSLMGNAFAVDTENDARAALETAARAWLSPTCAETVKDQARLVIEFMERETGLPFGDFIGAADRERIKAIANS